MKKILFAIISLAAFASCVEEKQEPVQKPEPFRLEAVFGNDGTKTVFNPSDNSVVWEDTDALSVLIDDGESTSVYKFIKTADVANAFECGDFTPEDGKTYTYSIIYPYSEEITGVDNDGYTNGCVGLPASKSTELNQSAVDDADHIKGALYAQATAEGGERPSVGMIHLSNILSATVTNNTTGAIDVRKITVGNDAARNLTGMYYVNCADGGTKLAEDSGSETVTVNVASGEIAPGESGKVYILTPAFTIPAEKKLTFTVFCSTGKALIEKTMTAELVCAAGDLRPVALEIDQDNFVEYTALPVPASVDMTAFLPDGRPKYITTNVTGVYTSSGANTGWKVDSKGEYIQFNVDGIVGSVKATVLGNSITGDSNLELQASSDNSNFTSQGTRTVVNPETVYEYVVTDESYRYFKFIYHKSGGNLSFRNVEFTGEDTRVPLGTPQNLTVETVEGTPNSVSISWDAVENATSYDVTCGSETSNIIGLTVTFENLEFSTVYDVSVIAKDDEGAYKQSAAAVTSVTTGESDLPTLTYALVENVSELVAGTKVVIVAAGYDVALSTEQNENNRGEAAITKTGDKTIAFTEASGVQIFTLEAGNKSGTLSFYTGSGYLYAASSKSNYLKTEKTLSDNSSWTVSIDDSGTATITAQGTNTKNLLQYNRTSTLFSCYGSAAPQKPVQVYKESAPASLPTPVLSAVGVAEITGNSALVWCEGLNLHGAKELKFYLKGGDKSAAATVKSKTFASVAFTGLTLGETYTYYAEAVDSSDEIITSDEGSFTTVAQNASKGWIELPVSNDISAEQVIRNGDGYQNRNYTAFYDTDTYSSLWVAYPLAPGHMGYIARPESDPWVAYDGLSNDLQINVWSGGYGVSYESKLNYKDNHYARGHQIANADRNGIENMQLQTFLAINSTPQIQYGFNGAIWATLEGAVRSVAKVLDAADSLYVATGPVYRTAGGSETIEYISPRYDTKQCPVPNYYFKVVLKVKRSGSTVTDAKSIGFWFEHKEYADSDYEACAVSVDEIERKTGYNFFANLPDEIEATAETNASWPAFTAF